jgi:gliding motility-associated-like protein
LITDNTGSIPLQSAGQSNTMLNGEETEVTIEQEENSFIFSFGGVNIKIGSTNESGEPVSPYENILVLDSTGETEIQGDGFLPGTLVSVWLISNETIGPGGRKNFDLPFLETSIKDSGEGWLRESRLMDTQPGAIYFLGLAEVSEYGLFKGSFKLPNSIPPGIYTLQATGISQTGDELTLSVGAAVGTSESDDEDPDGIPDVIKERILKEVLDELSLKIAWGNSSVNTEIPTKVLTLLSGGSIEEMRVNWNLTNLDKNLYSRGIYEYEGVLINPEVINLAGIKAKLILEVLPKPSPVDVILDNNRFKVGSSYSKNYFEIGKISIIDPVDDIHELELMGSDSDNDFFEIKDGVLYWNSINPAASRTEFTIKVKVTDRDGNQLEKLLLVNRERQSLEELEVYNTFTPNKDGRNDDWGIPGTRYYKDVILQIFERSGKLIFTSIDPDKKWDGNYQGKELPVGTYYWTLKIGETGQIRRGMINLLRK